MVNIEQTKFDKYIILKSTDIFIVRDMYSKRCVHVDQQKRRPLDGLLLYSRIVAEDVYMFDRLKNTWLFSLLGRLTIFFVLFSIQLLFLYIIGNYQEFLDSSQFFLLKILEIVSLLGGISGTYYIFFLFFVGVIEKKIMILRFILTIISIILCTFLFSGIKFLSSWFQY